MPPEESVVSRTYFWDRVRGFATGVIETGFGGFALIIAIQAFHAPDSVKSLLAAAGPVGLLLNPLGLSLIARWHAPANKVAAALSVVCGGLTLAAAYAPTLNGFLWYACLSFLIGAQKLPFLAHIWAENYPSDQRGSFLAVSMMFSIVSTLAFSLFGGWLLDADIGRYRHILICISVAYLASSWAFWRIPSTPVSRIDTESPLRNLGYAFSDSTFGIMLLAWMFLGFGNLMILPLRFEYLLQPSYGIEASELAVTALTLGIPAFFRFASSRFWGALFDRIDFMILRIILNALLILSTVLLFVGTNLWLIGLSAAVLGVAMGGANISWSLWVTKFAPPERTASYMSVHSFTTGIRGVVAPFLGFYLLSAAGVDWVMYISSGLIVISIGMVYALYRSHRPTTSVPLR